MPGVVLTPLGCLDWWGRVRHQEIRELKKNQEVLCRDNRRVEGCDKEWRKEGRGTFSWGSGRSCERR